MKKNIINFNEENRSSIKHLNRVGNEMKCLLEFYDLIYSDMTIINFKRQNDIEISPGGSNRQHIDGDTD